MEGAGYINAEALSLKNNFGDLGHRFQIYQIIKAVFPMTDLSHDIRSIDPRMVTAPVNRDGLRWHLPFEAPMRLFGFPWFEVDHVLNRLPLARPAEVTQFPNGVKTMVSAQNCGAYSLSSNTAGGQVRFRRGTGPGLLRLQRRRHRRGDHGGQ